MFYNFIKGKRFWTKIVSAAVVIATLNIFVLSSFVAADFSSTKATTIYKETKIDSIQSKAYALGNADANTVMQSGNGDAHLRAGNVMKLMTLYLTFEALASGKLTLETQLDVSVAAQEAANRRARVFLDGYKHERITVKQGLEAVCIASANDAAYVLAEGIAGTEQNFVAMMNAKAAELYGSINGSFSCVGIELEGAFDVYRGHRTLIFERWTIDKLKRRAHGKGQVRTGCDCATPW